MKNERLPMEESREWNNSEQLLFQVREYLDIDPEEGTEPDNYEENGQLCMEMVQQEICWRSWP